MQKLIKKRNHTYIDGEVLTSERVQTFTIHCNVHDMPFQTTLYNYKRSVIGCKFCGRESSSAKLTEREFSQETLERMRISANLRPDRGGKPRRWRETNSYRTWVSEVREEWNNECAVTGEKNLVDGDKILAAHHLESAQNNETLVLTVENGILLHRDVHKAFHDNCGYGSNTVGQFKDFIDKLVNNQIKIVKPISSQGESEDSQGSETRVYDPERIMKLQERLGEIEIILKAKLQSSSS